MNQFELMHPDHWWSNVGHGPVIPKPNKSEFGQWHSLSDQGLVSRNSRYSFFFPLPCAGGRVRLQTQIDGGKVFTHSDITYLPVSPFEVNFFQFICFHHPSVCSTGCSLIPIWYAHIPACHWHRQVLQLRLRNNWLIAAPGIFQPWKNRLPVSVGVGALHFCLLFFAAVLQMLRAKHAAHVLKELPLLRPGVVEYKNYFCGNMVKYHEIFFHFEFCRVSFSSFFFPLFGLLLVILLLFILFVFLLLGLIAAFLLWVLQVLNAKHRAHAERFALYRSWATENSVEVWNIPSTENSVEVWNIPSLFFPYRRVHM